MINIGDYVTRKSYKHDILFKVIDKEDNNYILTGVNVRLIADAKEEDLTISSEREENDEEVYERVERSILLDRNEYFYIPGKILHLDSDKSYLKRCLELYKKSNIVAYGKVLNEKDMAKEIEKFLIETNPDIVVITGHDALLKNKNGMKKLYRNSDNFIKAVIQARKYEKSNFKLAIIAGACQSNYEGLINAGSTFASSPKRINIHALDPAIIAVNISLSERGSKINIIDVLNKTKYKEDGIGGLVSEGMMSKGYPRDGK